MRLLPASFVSSADYVRDPFRLVLRTVWSGSCLCESVLNIRTCITRRYSCTDMHESYAVASTYVYANDVSYLTTPKKITSTRLLAAAAGWPKFPK